VLLRSRISIKYTQHSSSTADLERTSVGINQSAVSFALSRVKHPDVAASVGPQVHAAAVATVSVEASVVHLVHEVK